MLMGDYNVIYVVSIFNLIQHKEYMRILKRQLKLQVYLRHGLTKSNDSYNRIYLLRYICLVERSLLALFHHLHILKKMQIKLERLIG